MSFSLIKSLLAWPLIRCTDYDNSLKKFTKRYKFYFFKEKPITSKYKANVKRSTSQGLSTSWNNIIFDMWFNPFTLLLLTQRIIYSTSNKEQSLPTKRKKKYFKLQWWLRVDSFIQKKRYNSGYFRRSFSFFPQLRAQKIEILEG